jgi:hypothetical protein
MNQRWSPYVGQSRLSEAWSLGSVMRRAMSESSVKRALALAAAALKSAHGLGVVPVGLRQ